MQASSSPPSRFMRLAIYAALICIAMPGLAAIYSLIAYNPARGDEFFSFVENYDCGFGQLMLDIRQGLDVSYLHAAASWVAFKLFGHTLYVQRGLSFIFYIGALSHLYFLFRVLYKSNLLAWVLVCSIAFCNLGLFIASDGRFYAMLFYISVAFMHYMVYKWAKGERLSALMLIIIQLFGLLVSAQFMMLQALVLAGLIISQIINKDKMLLKSVLMPIFISSTLSTIVYFVVFRIQFFTGFQMGAIMQDHHEVFSEIAMDSAENLLRWLLLPANYLIMGIVAFFIIRLSMYFAVNRKMENITPTLQIFCIVMGVSLPVLFFIKIGLCNIVGSYYIWPSRYYTPVFFCISFLTAYIFRAMLKTTAESVLLFIYLLMGLWGTYEYYDRYSIYSLQKYSFTALAKTLQSGTYQVAVVQNTENSTEEIQFYSALYCFHPELAGRLQLNYDGGDKFRKQFMQTLQLKRPNAHVYLSTWPTKYDSVALNKCTYYIVNQIDKRFKKFDQDRIAGSNNMNLIYNP